MSEAAGDVCDCLAGCVPPLAERCGGPKLRGLGNAAQAANQPGAVRIDDGRAFRFLGPVRLWPVVLVLRLRPDAAPMGLRRS